MKRTQLRAKTGFKRPLAPKQPKVRVPLKKKRSGQKSGKSSVPKLPLWVRTIPESQAHGSGTLQKRLWRVTSDFVRIRDWYFQGGICVATGKKILRWQDGHAGHFKSYAKCNGMFKFDERNIHLQSAQSNGWGDRDDWKYYEEELKRRVNPDIIEAIESANRACEVRITNEYVLLEIRETMRKMALLPEQPEYYTRAVSLLDTQS